MNTNRKQEKYWQTYYEQKAAISDDFKKCVYQSEERMKKLHNRIINNLKIKSGELLDYGCGPGLLAKKFAEMNFEVTEIDISEKMIEKAKQNFGNTIEFRQASVENIDFKTESFSVIVLAEVIQYMNHEETLNKFIPLLRPGGQLIISGPNYSFFKHQNRQRSFLQKFKDLILTLINIARYRIASNYKPIKLPNFIKMIKKTNQCQSIIIDCSSVIDNQYNNFVISIIKK